MKKLSKRTWVLVAAVVAVAVAAVGGYAYWTTGGTGTGSATATTTANLTVNQTNAAITNLYPGGPVQALSGNFTNPNGFSVNIASVTAAVTDVTGEGTDPGQPACTTADFAITGSTGSIVVPAGPGAVGAWSGLNVQLVDNSLNQDNCKGATAVITYTVNAT